MTREQFDEFLEEVRQRGFTRVKTNDGKLPLEKWYPYGAFGGSNPGIEKYIDGFRWIDDRRAADGEPHGAFAAGVWEFC